MEGQVPVFIALEVSVEGDDIPHDEFTRCLFDKQASYRELVIALK